MLCGFKNVKLKSQKEPKQYPGPNIYKEDNNIGKINFEHVALTKECCRIAMATMSLPLNPIKTFLISIVMFS